MKWIKPDIKMQPNALAIQAALNRSQMFEYDNTKDYLHDNMIDYISAHIIGNIGALPVGLGQLGTDIGSFNLWMKRMFPCCKYEKLNTSITVNNLSPSNKCVIWVKNFAVYVENDAYYSFRNIDGIKIFGIWWL